MSEGGRTMTGTIKFRSDADAELITHMGADEVVAQAARVSTLGLDNDREKYRGLVRALMRDGHWSPFEHPHMTIAMRVPRFVRTQVLRHRSMTFSEFSLRYSRAKTEFWVPAEDRPLVEVGKSLDYRREAGTGEQLATTLKHMRRAAESSWARYEHLVDSVGVAKEVARAVLPDSIYTDLWVTGSLRSWIHFVGNRMDKHAQYEVQGLGAQVAQIMREKFPVVTEAAAEYAWKEEG